MLVLPTLVIDRAIAHFDLQSPEVGLDRVCDTGALHLEDRLVVARRQHPAPGLRLDASDGPRRRDSADQLDSGKDRFAVERHSDGPNLSRAHSGVNESEPKAYPE